MSTRGREESYVATLIRTHPVGTVPKVATFQTAQDIDEYIDDTQKANQEGLRKLSEARSRSLVWARTHLIG